MNFAASIKAIRERPSLFYSQGILFMHAFYLPPENWKEPFTLTGQEAHHLSKVLRMKQGENILLLDGQGREGTFQITEIHRQHVILKLLSSLTHPRPHSGLILAAGWGKAARRGWILEKAVEFEASGLWFWQAERSQFPVPDDIRQQWQAQLVAGAKQCHNPWLPELRTISGGVSELIAIAQTIEHKQVLVESGYQAQAFLSMDYLAQPGLILCVVGPEGGFAPGEVDAFQKAGFETFTMGTRILRWESAALMALGLHWWGRQMSSAS